MVGLESAEKRTRLSINLHQMHYGHKGGRNVGTGTLPLRLAQFGLDPTSPTSSATPL